MGKTKKKPRLPRSNEGRSGARLRLLIKVLDILLLGGRIILYTLQQHPEKLEWLLELVKNM